MQKLWRRWRSASSADELPPAFQIDELSGEPYDSPDVSTSWAQVQTTCVELIREIHRQRAAAKQAVQLGEQVEAARQEAKRLSAEVVQLRQLLDRTQAPAVNQAAPSQQAREALLLRFANEVFTFQKTLRALEARDFAQQLPADYKVLQALHSRMIRLLREEDVVILDPEGRAPEPAQVDVLMFMPQPEVAQDIIVETLRPIVMLGGRIIARGKVVVAAPPQD